MKMKMRMPAAPLITVDPYFSVWSHDDITDKYPVHWTGAQNAIRGTVTVDGAQYRFLGAGKETALQQVSVAADALTTEYIFEGAGIRLTARFTSPLLVEDLYYTSRPVSYLHLSFEDTDGKHHVVSAKLSCSEELVLNRAGEGRALSQPAAIDGVSAIRMGNGEQKVLWRSGDDVRIDWGYFYLGVRGKAQCGAEVFDGLYAVYAETALGDEALFLFGYDDIESMEYFGERLPAYWRKDGKTIDQAISEAAAEYESLKEKCDLFAERLTAEATEKGGSEYAELLSLAYRQVMAAHKLVVDKEGNNLYVSKECFSGGFTATVDVTYPSAPMYLKYNPELLKGMLRPVFRFARMKEWPYDFAPHDVGMYPFMNGEQYYPEQREKQMPVEECGNMLTLVDAICRIEDDYAIAEENIDLLEQWSRYLEEYGEDPENQLCTDDFAGHMPHNVNLAIKAVMGLSGYADILRALGNEGEAERVFAIAGRFAESICARAKNSDGSCRLAFDRPDTFSLKYNAIWDKLWKTGLFDSDFYCGEIERYKKEALPYGVPLDSRSKYTKSDWELWAACLAEDNADFRYFVHLIYAAFDTMHTRVPMTDWYYADISEMVMFRHRTVQGGLFLKLLME